MKTFTALVKIGGGGNQTRVQIQAANSTDAIRLLEAQYGKGNVSSVSEVR